MMQSAPDNSVRIEQLQLQCSASQRATVMDALDAADWPHIDEREILILRRLEINSEAWAIGREAAERVRSLVDQAVTPWSGNTLQAQAVRFRDHAELAACLCREVLRPSYPLPWYWQNHTLAAQALQQPPASAILSILSEKPLQLPAVIDRLMMHGLLGATLATLGEERIQHLVALAVHVTGFPVSPSLLQARPETLQQMETEFSSVELPAHTSELQRWRLLLDNLPQSLASTVSSLAALLIAWHNQPFRLHQKENATLTVLRLKEELLLPLPPTGFEASASEPHYPSEIGTPDTFASPGNVETRAKRPLDQPGAQPADGGDHTDRDSPTKRAPDAEISIDQTRAVEQPEALQQFVTTDGGLFYLINVLRQPALQEILTVSKVDPWQHLYMMSRLLELELDLPLREFLISQLNLGSLQALDELTPDKQDHQLIELAEKRLAHHGFWPDALIRRTSRVRHDRVHLDIEFHHDSIDLDIRLAGLDVNPGWLPWLGRVVNFHYLDDPLLRGVHA